MSSNDTFIKNAKSRGSSNKELEKEFDSLLQNRDLRITRKFSVKDSYIFYSRGDSNSTWTVIEDLHNGLYKFCNFLIRKGSIKTKVNIHMLNYEENLLSSEVYEKLLDFYNNKKVKKPFKIIEGYYLNRKSKKSHEKSLF